MNALRYFMCFIQLSFSKILSISQALEYCQYQNQKYHSLQDFQISESKSLILKYYCAKLSIIFLLVVTNNFLLPLIICQLRPKLPDKLQAINRILSIYFAVQILFTILFGNCFISFIQGPLHGCRTYN